MSFAVEDVFLGFRDKIDSVSLGTFVGFYYINGLLAFVLNVTGKS